MNFKRLTAFAVVATMVVGNCVTAFATENATGAGIVEYDDSTDVVYDSVTVPTLVVNNTYAFSIDPTGLLEDFGIKSEYEDATVFFNKVKTHAKLEASATGGHLYKEVYTAVTPTDGNYSGIATCTIDADGVATYTAIADNYYLWVPKTAYQTDGVNKSGEYVAIDTSNVKDFFNAPADNTITFRDDYRAGNNVCDGKVYKRTGEAVDPITASYAEPITKWVTLSGTTVTAVDGLWTDASLAADKVAGAGDVKYTAATYTYNSSTDEAYFVNKSTKSKDVTVKVTLENATGLTINNSATFEGTDNEASVYFAAMNGATPVAFSETDGVVSATFTATLAGAVDAGETLYQTTQSNAAGGHKYGRFTGPNPTYTNHSFSITAAANKNAGAADAWKTYGASVTADTRPQLKVVYTYADHQDANTVTFNTGSGSSVASQNVAIGGKATRPETDPTLAGKNFGGWYADDEFTTEFDFDTVITAATTIYAKWDNPTEVYANYVAGQSNSFWIGLSSSKGFGTEPVVTSLVADGSVDLTDVVAITEYGTTDKYWITVSWADASAAGLVPGNHTFAFCADGVWYTASYTNN